MLQITISLLGNFSVALDTTPVTGFTYDKVRALLAYLAVEADRPHHREKLADLLWSGYPERSARQNLSHTLSILRNATGDREIEPPFLIVNHRELQFNTESDHWLDIAAFTEHIRAIQTYTDTSAEDAGAVSAHLQQAADLYRGDFLADLIIEDSIPFEEWALLQRERLRRQILDVLTQLAENALQHSEPESAIQYASRQLALDAWRESAHRQMMRALVLSGQRNAAIAHYEDCRRTLAADLGVEPEAATMELAGMLKSNAVGNITLQLIGAGNYDLAPEPGEPPFMGLKHFDVGAANRFFGREALTNRLIRQLVPATDQQSDSASSTGGFLAIVGASGSGKSSLVRAGLVAAIQRGHAISGSENWSVHLITPTAHPLESLALSLTRDNESVTAAATLMDDMTREPRSLHLYLRKLNQRIGEPRITNHELRASSIAHPASSIQHLLVIDQFEELFTLCRSAQERAAFIDNLLTAATTPGLQDSNAQEEGICVVITLRADFYDHCAEYPNLRDALSRHQAYIGPLTPDGLRHAIEEPAAQGKWAFEPGLVDLMLRDIGADGVQSPEPGALPLLSHALLETWRRRRGRTLTLGGYTEAGGVRGAIAKTADAVYAQLTSDQQTLARNLFLRLTELGAETQDTRRRVARAEILSDVETAPAVADILNTLADARLITLEQDIVQVAHEVLIREWPALRGWLEEDRDGLRVHRHLTESALEWQRLARDPSELYRGARLAQATEWSTTHLDAVNPLEREYLTASLAEAQRIEQERETQRQRELEAAQKLAVTEQGRAAERGRMLRWIGLIAVLLLVAAVAAGILGNQARLTAQENATLADNNANIAATAVAVSELEAEQRAVAELAQQQEVEQRAAAEESRIEADEQRTDAESARDEAQQQAHRALASQLAAQAPTLLDEGVDLALLLGVQAYNTYALPQSQGALLDVLDFYPGLIRILSGHDIDVHSVAFSPDGKWLASADLDNTIQLWNVENDWHLERTIQQGINTSSVNYNVKETINDVMVFSPDGRIIALGDWTSPMLVLWEVSTGERLRTLGGQKDSFRTIAFSPDGERLASGSRDGLLTLWDVETGVPLISPLRVYKEGIDKLDFHPNGKTLVTAGCLDRKGHTLDACFQSEMHLWDVERLLTFDENNPMNTQEGISQTIPGPVAGIGGFAFTPDGSRLIFQGYRERRPDGWGFNQVVTLWDLLRNEPVSEISLEKGERAQYLGRVAIRPDNTLFVTPGEPGETIKMWDMQTLHPIKSIPSFGYGVKTLTFNPQGTILALGLENGDVYLWDVATLLNAAGNAGSGSGSHFAIYNRTEGGSILTSLAFSLNGNQLAAGSFDGGVSVWNVATGEPIRTPLTVHGHYVFDLDFSPDGAKLATASFDGTIRLWDTATWEMVGEPLTGHTSAVTYVAWSYDSKTLFSGSYDGTIRRWDVATGQPIGEPLSEHTDQVIGITVSPDGTRLASASRDTTVRLWDAGTGEPIGGPLIGHTAGVGDVAFSPDGKLLASCGHDATIRLWDVETMQPSGGPLTGHQDRVWAVAFTHDGKTLASVDMDGKLRYWDMATRRPIGAPIQAHSVAFDATFSPDGTVLATAGGDDKGNGEIRFWDTDPTSWKTRVCNIVGRNLTRSEWERYLPDVPYEKTCTQWPAGE